MAVISKLKAQLSLDDRKFKAGLKGAEKQTKSFGNQISEVGKAIAGAFAVKQVLAFANATLKAYDIQAKAEAKLLTALKGREDQQQRLIKQASELQNITLFGDEVTIEAQAMLAALGLTAYEIERLTPLVQDLATKANMSLVTAADLVAKSVGSQTNALSRYGIVIEGAVGSSERFESAMRSLNQQVGGQAVAAAKAGTGALTQMSNVLGDIQEDIGETIAPDVIRLANAIIILGNAARDSKSSISDFFDAFKYSNVIYLAYKYSVATTEWIASLVAEKDAVDNLVKSYEKYNKATIQAFNIKIDKKDSGVPVPYAPGYKPEPIKQTVIVDYQLSSSYTGGAGAFATSAILGLQNAIDLNDKAFQNTLNLSHDLVASFYQVGEAADDIVPSVNQIAQTMTYLADTIIQGLINQIGNLLASLGELAVTGEFNGDALLNSFGAFLQQLGVQLITYGLLLAGFGEALAAFMFGDFYTKIAAGLALAALGALLVVAGGAVSALGGSAPTGGGAYSTSYSTGYSGNAGYDYNREIILTARGEDLVAVINRTNYKYNVNG